MADDAPQIMQTEFVETGEAVREDAQVAQMATRTRRLAQYEQILQLRQSKVSVSTITSQVGLSTKTVQRWLAQENVAHSPKIPPIHGIRSTRTNKIPFNTIMRGVTWSPTIRMIGG